MIKSIELDDDQKEFLQQQKYIANLPKARKPANMDLKSLMA